MKLFLDITPIRYIRARPFSMMALCNIMGDLGYLGYAFAADGFVSAPKLVGALFAMGAHIILLAHGDDQGQLIAVEQGALPRLILKMRSHAKQLTAWLPNFLEKEILAKPVGITFSMLALNGVGLLLDVFIEVQSAGGQAMIIQLILGILITAGTATFAAADFVRSQNMANIFTKLAPSILLCASAMNIGLAVTTLNPFLIMSVMAFAISNFAGFFTRINKEKGQHLHG